MEPLALAPDAPPDAIIEQAWDAGLDRKAVIREASDAAGLLLADVDSELVTLFWPMPRPLEAVDHWLGTVHEVSGAAVGLRPFASAVLPGCAVGLLASRFVAGSTALVAIIVAANVVLGLLFKRWLAAVMKRRVARLDEETAKAIALAELRRGMVANPMFVPRATVWIRRGLGLPASG